MKKVTATCPQCGKDFQYYPSTNRGKPKIHCSRVCQSDATWLHKECAWCGAAFTCRKSDPTNCCSKTCGRRRAMQGRKITRACDQCGKLVTRKQSDFYGKGQSNHFCSRRCFGDWMKVHTPDHIADRKKTRVDRACKECGKAYRIAPSQLLFDGYGNFCSHRCKGLWHSRQPGAARPPVHRGTRNGNWKGGYKKYYGPSWREQRRQARKRDGYTCCRCGITEIDLGIELDVHHIQPFRTFGLARHQEANHIDNLISLCNLCHKAIEPRGCIKP